MKPGERAPKGVRELVLKLAGRNPRPTNREIREEVQTEFRVEIAERTVARYCEKAGLPTSSRQGKVKGRLLDEESAQPRGDVELGPHGRELFYFGQRLRDRLGLPMLRLSAWLRLGATPVPMWGEGQPSHARRGEFRHAEEEAVEMDWGYNRYDARSHPVFPLFWEHLIGYECWLRLEDAERGFEAHEAARREFCHVVQERVGTQLPPLDAQDRECLENSLLESAYNRASGYSLEFTCEPNKAGDGEEVWWRLLLGNRWMLRVDQPEDLEPYARAAQELFGVLVSCAEVKDVAESEHSLQRAIQAFKETLTPDAVLRKLIIQGHCKACLDPNSWPAPVAAPE